MGIDLSFIKDEYFLKILNEYFNKLFQTGKRIKGIILFGSLARNKAIHSEEKLSDIDLIVIFSDNEIPEDHKKLTEVKLDLMGLSLSGIDSIWVKETEFKNLIQNKVDLILDCMNDGKILFDPDGLIEEQKIKLFKELKEKGVKKRKSYWIWPLKQIGDEIEW